MKRRVDNAVLSPAMHLVMDGGMLPNGKTMAEAALPLLAESYTNGKQPPLLEAFTTR